MVKTILKLMYTKKQKTNTNDKLTSETKKLLEKRNVLEKELKKATMEKVEFIELRKLIKKGNKKLQESREVGPLKKLRKFSVKGSINGRKLGKLRFIDDVVLISSRRNKLENIANSPQETSNQ